MFVGDINPARNREIGKCFAGEFHYKDIKFPVKIRDIHKIEKTWNTTSNLHFKIHFQETC